MASDHLTGALRRILGDTLRAGLRSLQRGPRPAPLRSAPTPAPGRRRAAPPPLSAEYPGDYRGMPRTSYSPVPGRRPDPGEVVWTWVPFEEDHGRGKDRPVLLVGRDGDWLLGLQLTSQDHDRDAAQEAAEGRYWTDIGSGPWDGAGRPSEARVNRVVRVHPDEVRRTTSAVPRATFDHVVDAMRRHLA